MQGIVHQISVSPGGIPKLEIREARVSKNGIEGDSCRNRRFHGGPKQAILLISLEDLQILKGLGYPVYPGALGENLTVTGIPFRDVRIGDQFRVGSVRLQITKLRQPCRTLDEVQKGIQLALYDKTPGSSLWGRGGFYASVLEEGIVLPGDIIAKVNSEV